MKMSSKFASLLFSLALIFAVSVAVKMNTGCGQTTVTFYGPEGGTASSSDGKADVIIPAGAISGLTLLSVDGLSNTDLPVRLRNFDDIDYHYHLEPDDYNFNSPVTVKFNISPGDIPEYLTQSSITSLVLMMGDQNSISYITDSNAWVDPDTGNYTISGTTEDFSYVTASEGFLTITLSTRDVNKQVGDTQNITVTLRGRTNFIWDISPVNECLIKNATLTTTVPDFASINPSEKTFIDQTSTTSSQTFTVTCDAEGSGNLSFNMADPQVYTFVADSGDTEFTNDSQFSVTIPITCTN